jgi:hypothetical protein
LRKEGWYSGTGIRGADGSAARFGVSRELAEAADAGAGAGPEEAFVVELAEVGGGAGGMAFMI